MDLSDGELVERVRHGDVETYRLLVERHYGDCLRYAARALGNAHDAEEAVQDTFARAYRFLNRYDENRKFKGWLFGILVNQCRTVAASRIRREATLVSIDVVEGTELPRDGMPGDNDRAFDVNVQRALLRIEPAHREALLLKYADDWTYEEIAEVTGARVSALKMRVKRARAQLVELLRGVTDEA